ncbi:porin family protein [Marinilabilia sp.]|uniref:porin family protein n=1 Tax=Marinilabilia sp. TaxID=2021252 RepID=UPI0025C535DA|nr:porin family protein [Marinilabilia sp.]
MKKVLFFVAVMLLSVSTASIAQAKFGLKAGVNIANATGDDVEDADSRLAPFFGAFVNLGLGEKLAFQPELLYSMKGIKNTSSIMGVDFDQTTKLNYLDIPLMLKYNIAGGLNLQAGPQVSLLLSAENEYEGGGESETEDIKEYLKGSDFGFNVGAGYDFGPLGVDVRYNIGLSNISDEEDGDIKNSVIQVGLSYSF